MAILIKRYANRKLYNTESSRYITLKGIAKLLEEGEEVSVIDNETGDDITQVALSQILVDNQRAHEDPSETLLSQILSKGGDALYGAIRKSVDDATEGIGEFQDRFRRIVSQADPGVRGAPGFAWNRRASDRTSPFSNDSKSSDSNSSDAKPSDSNGVRSDATSPAGSASAHVATDLDRTIRSTLVEVLESFDFPSRRDIESLTKNLERVAGALERLEAEAKANVSSED